MVNDGYLLTYQEVIADGQSKLRVLLPTKEFGELESRWLDAVEDKNINRQLLDSLADEVIAEYEQRIQGRPTQVTGMSFS